MEETNIRFFFFSFSFLGGRPLLELNRILRPGGFFVWSATPVYRHNERDETVWNGNIFICIC